jgi:hypothetical protein
VVRETTRYSRLYCLVVSFSTVFLVSPVQAAPRDIHDRSVDFQISLLPSSPRLQRTRTLSPTGLLQPICATVPLATTVRSSVTLLQGSSRATTDPTTPRSSSTERRSTSYSPQGCDCQSMTKHSTASHCGCKASRRATRAFYAEGLDGQQQQGLRSWWLRAHRAA